MAGLPGVAQPSRLKLLDITKFYSPSGGGVKTYLAAKAAWLAGHAEVEHVLVLPSERDGVETIGNSRVYLIRGPRIPGSPGYRFLLSPRTLRAIVMVERPDIIEVGSPFLVPWLARYAARGTHARLIGFFHSDDRQVFVDHALAGAPRLLREAGSRLLARYLAAVYRRFVVTVATSRASALALGRMGVPAVATIPLGTDVQLFDPVRRDPAWRRTVGAGDGEIIALYVGRFSREKGIDLVLEALPGLHAEARVRLVLVGEGTMRRRLEALAGSRPEMLTVLPYQQDRLALARIYASTDLAIAPCPYETFGLAALEAMASGLPVVGVSTGGVGQLLAGAEWARTYQPGNPSDCARAVREVIRAGPAQLGRRARAAAAEYSWDRTFRELLALYRRVAAQESLATLTASRAGG